MRKKIIFCIVLILFLTLFTVHAGLLTKIIIQYDASTDYDAGNVIYNGLKNDYDNLVLKQISYSSWSDSSFYNTFSSYEVVVVVGAQGANSLYAWLVSKGLIRNAVESDNGSALVQETTLTLYGKNFKIFAVGSWSEEGTVRSANEALWRFCRDSDFGITYSIKGDVKYIDGNYNHITSNDRCDFSNTDVLEEFYCLDYNSKSSINKACSDYDNTYCDGNVLTTKDYFCNSGRCDYSLSTLNCPNGCQNNACVGCTPPKVWRNNRCEYPCCYNDDLWWCYEGNVQDIKEDCQVRCENNVCINCTYYNYTSCYNNDVYWYDSCGNREDMKEDCFARCEYGLCCIHHSSSYCYENDIYWRDSCGNTEEIKENCNSQDTYLSNNQCISIKGQRQKDVYRLKKDYFCSGGDTSCQYSTYYEKVQNCTDNELCIQGQCKPYKASDFVCNEDNTSVCHYYGGWNYPENCSSGCDQGTTLKGHNYAYCHEDRFDVGQFTKGNNCSGCDETWCSYCSDQNTETHCRWDSDYYEQRWVREDKHCDYGCDQSKGICKDTSCHNGVRDYDEEGVDCGGSCDVCKVKLKILILPMRWNGSFQDYKEATEQIKDYIVKTTNITDCSANIKILSLASLKEKFTLDVATVMNCKAQWAAEQSAIALYGFNCIEVFSNALYFGCYAQTYATQSGNNYDYVIGISDLDIGKTAVLGCNPGSFSFAGWIYPWSNIVVAEAKRPSVALHELGHKFGLSDEYCDCGDYCGNASSIVNKLKPELGCNISGNCCYPATSDYYPYDPSCKWCNGNLDIYGFDKDNNIKPFYDNRSLMSLDTVYNTKFDKPSLNHLKTFNQFQCDSNIKSFKEGVSQIFSEKNSENFSESVLEINLVIQKNNKISNSNISIGFGNPSLNISTGKSYSLRILDKKDNLLYKKDFDIYFFLLSDPPTLINETIFVEKIKYDLNMVKILLYYNNTPVYTYNLNFCSNNSICEQNENYYSCPSDCEPWAADGICRAVRDYNCDPDCIENADPDCFKLELHKGWNLVSYPVILNISTENLTKNIEGKYKVIYTYNSSEQITKWKKFSLTETGPHYFNEINNVKGLWVYMNQNGTLEMSGLPSINTNFILKNGWNLISYPSLTELETNEAFNEVSNEIIVVYAFENNEWTSYSPLKNNVLNTLRRLKPGMALWINVNKDTVWIFDKGFKKY